MHPLAYPVLAEQHHAEKRGLQEEGDQYLVTEQGTQHIAGGLGEYLNVDATIVRLLFVLFALAGGPGLLVYIVMLLVVPEEPLDAPSTVVEVEMDEAE